MLWKHIIVADHERALITKNGRFGGILPPGEYRLFIMSGVSLDVEKHNVRDLVFESAWADYLAKERPEIAERHFTRVETNDFQVAMVYVDGQLFKVMLPAKRMLFWRGAMDVTAEVVNVIDESEVSAQKLPALQRLGRESLITFCLVEQVKVGYNRLTRFFPPGKYGFWAVTASPPTRQCLHSTNAICLQ